MKKLIVVGIALVLAACGGGGGGGDSSPIPPPPVVNADPGGTWNGSVTNTTLGQTYDAVGLSISSGEIRFYDVQGNSYFGQITVTGTDYSGSITAFAAPGFVFSDGSTVTTGTIGGEIIQRQLFTGTYSIATGEQGVYTFTFDATYDRDSSLGLMEGTWADEFGAIYSIDSQGRIFGQDAGGCVYNGQVSIIDSNYDAYRINITLSNCPGLNGQFTGLGTLSDYVSGLDNRLFIFQANNGNIAATTTYVVKI